MSLDWLAAEPTRGLDRFGGDSWTDLQSEVAGHTFRWNVSDGRLELLRRRPDGAVEVGLFER